MTKAQYEEIQERLRKKLKTHNILSGNRSSDYKDGIKAAMSIVRDIYRRELENDRLQ